MGGRLIRQSEASAMLICLDQFSGYDWKGRIYVRSRVEPELFSGILELFEKMEMFYDRIEFPRASTLCRSFRALPAQERQGPQDSQGCVSGAGTWTAAWSEQSMKEQRGALATFLVRIQYRQRTSWQGLATWLERDETETFNSMLELLKQMTNVKEAEKNGNF